MNTPPYRFDAPRAYLFVSTGEPLAASAALSTWDAAPPEFCVTSPSGRAHDTAVIASAGHYVRQIVEPMLASRRPAESMDDFADRFAEAILIVLDLGRALGSRRLRRASAGLDNAVVRRLRGTSPARRAARAGAAAAVTRDVEALP